MRSSTGSCAKTSVNRLPSCPLSCGRNGKLSGGAGPSSTGPQITTYGYLVVSRAILMHAGCEWMSCEAPSGRLLCASIPWPHGTLEKLDPWMITSPIADSARHGNSIHRLAGLSGLPGLRHLTRGHCDRRRTKGFSNSLIMTQPSHNL